MAEAAGLTSHKKALKRAMIERLIQTEAHFKHQQRGEPDLGAEEKAQIAESFLKKGSVLFLDRFSKFLALEDVQYFSDERGDYTVAFYLEEIEHRCRDSKHNIVKNRRYQALQELTRDGEYFSEEEMKWRDPLLFEQMVGQYMDDSEKAEKEKADIDKSDVRFSSILLKHMDIQTSKQLYGTLKEREEEQLEESDEESSDDEGDDMNTEGNASLHADGSDDDTGMTDVEKSHMRGEFVRIMQERFLAGEDKNFDYSKVDNNTDYDSLDILAHDAEERYFDADDVEESGQELCDSVSQRLAGVDLDQVEVPAVQNKDQPTFLSREDNSEAHACSKERSTDMAVESGVS